MTDIATARLTRRQAAERIRDLHGLPCTEGQLANHASDGTGPTYRLFGPRAFYLDTDVDAWARSRISPPIRKAADARLHLHGRAA